MRLGVPVLPEGAVPKHHGIGTVREQTLRKIFLCINFVNMNRHDLQVIYCAGSQ